MKNQLKGIALILFGILAAMASCWWANYFDPQFMVVPYLIGSVIGIVGLVFAFSKEK